MRGRDYSRTNTTLDHSAPPQKKLSAKNGLKHVLVGLKCCCWKCNTEPHLCCDPPAQHRNTRGLKIKGAGCVVRVCGSRWNGGTVRVEEEHCGKLDLNGFCLLSVDCGKHHKAKAVIDMNNKSASWQRDVSQAADWRKAMWQRERPGVSPWCRAALITLRSALIFFFFFIGWDFCLFGFWIFKCEV